MATLDFRVKNGLVTGANNTTLGTAVTVLLGGNVGIGDSNPSSKLAVSGTLNATGAITQGGNQVLHAGNYNSYSPTLTGTGASGTWGINITGDAGTVDGYSASTSAFMNTIVVRDASNYAYFNYINSNTASGENPAVSQVIVTNAADGFYRKASISHLTSAVQTNASGNWSINSLNITQYPLNQDVRTTASPTFAGLTSTGAVSVPAGFTVRKQDNANEGAEITFEKATNSTLAGNIIIDNASNAIRIFEGAGSFRGVTLDITGCGSQSALLHSSNYNSYAPTLTGGNASGTWGISISGSAATLTTARTINGTSFNGSANITTVSWGTARTLTIGNTGKLVDGSGGVAWSLTEIGVPSLTGTGASGTWGISITGNAATVAGYGVASTATGSTVALRDGSGHLFGVYLYSQYLNMTHASSSRTGDTIFYSSYDDFVRKNDAAGMRGSLNVPTRTGGDASGTWGINVTGNAGTATTATYSINTTQSFASNWNTDFANTPAGSMNLRGDTSTGTSTGGPGGSWWFQENFRHNNNSSTWGVQVAWGWEDNANTLRTRNVQNGAFGAWVTYLNSGNYNSYSPTLTGTGASGTWGISITGNASGNAGTATTLQTARNINGTSFNGSANITTATWGTARSITIGGTAKSVDGSAAVSWSLTEIGVPSLTGTGASGTWGISISGNAATATTASTAGSATTFTSTSQNSQFNSIGIGTGASGTAGEIRATNNITAYYSDKRLKENIKRIDNPLEKISMISGVTYNSNDIAASYGYTDKSTQVGVIAQEIEKVLPMAVKHAPFDIDTRHGVEYSKSGENYLTVQYEKIIPLLIESIKELKSEIDKLKRGR